MLYANVELLTGHRKRLTLSPNHTKLTGMQKPIALVAALQEELDALWVQFPVYGTCTHFIALQESL